MMLSRKPIFIIRNLMRSAPHYARPMKAFLELILGTGRVSMQVRMLAVNASNRAQILVLLARQATPRRAATTSCDRADLRVGAEGRRALVRDGARR